MSVFGGVFSYSGVDGHFLHIYLLMDAMESKFKNKMLSWDIIMGYACSHLKHLERIG